MKNQFLIILPFLFINQIASQENIVDYSSPEKHYDYGGNDISINGATGINVLTAADCAAECDKIPNKQCTGFVYWKTRFFGNIYGHTGVEIAAGSCYPKSSMKSSTFISDGDVYAYKSNLRHSSSIKLNPKLWFSFGFVILLLLNLN